MVSLSFISPIVEDDVVLFFYISPKLFGVSFCSLCNFNLLIFMDVPCYLTDFVSDLLKPWGVNDIVLSTAVNVAMLEV